MFSAAVHLLPIKDLKDLSVFFRSARFYRHAGPKGPEEVFFTGVIAGDRPPRYEKKRHVTVGRGPVPRRASVSTGNGLGWRVVFAQVERSRGTGPRTTMKRPYCIETGRSLLPGRN